MTRLFLILTRIARLVSISERFVRVPIFRINIENEMRDMIEVYKNRSIQEKVVEKIGNYVIIGNKRENLPYGLK